MADRATIARVAAMIGTLLALAGASASGGESVHITPDARREIAAVTRAYQHLSSFSATIDYVALVDGPGATDPQKTLSSNPPIEEHQRLFINRPNLFVDTQISKDLLFRAVSDGRRIYSDNSLAPGTYSVRPAPKRLDEALSAANDLEGSRGGLSLFSDLFSEKDPPFSFSHGYTSVVLGPPGELKGMPVITLLALGNADFSPPNAREEYTISRSDHLLRRIVITGTDQRNIRMKMTILFRNILRNPRPSRSMFRFFPVRGARAVPP